LKSRFTNQLQGVSGTAKIVNMNEPAKLMFSFEGAPMPTESNYMIVDTDYTCYALISNCMVVGGKKVEASWIMSRTPRLASSKVMELKNLMRYHSVDITRFMVSDQNCY
jgi:lipocalin